jgi:hypothetical protein
MNDAILDYFKEYRQTRQDLDDISRQMKTVRASMDELTAKAHAVQKELDGMRKIITVMVETGMDPVEAKLKNDVSDLSSSLWVDTLTDSMTMASIALAPTTITWTGGGASGGYTPLTIGATGATGAIGASIATMTSISTSYPNSKPMRVPGANGTV